MSLIGKEIYQLIFSNNGDAPYNGCGLIPKRGTIVRFVLQSSSSIYIKTPKLFTNFPISNQSFLRDQWNEVQPTCKLTGEYDWYADICVDVPGAFDYYLTWNNDDENSTPRIGKMGHFVINPVLHLGHEIKPLSIACLSIQTVLTKCLGPLERWQNHFAHAAAAGYNMIHFTPIQELGRSLSSYSLYHQLIISNQFFLGEKLLEEEKFDRISNLFLKAAKEYGVFTMGDLVLNHTSNDSPWLVEHPESTYNIDNCPYLKPALELDTALFKLSSDLITGKYVSQYNIVQITNENELGTLRKIIQENIIPSLQLWEYYLLNVDKAVGDLSTALLQKKKSSKIYNISVYDEHAVLNLIRNEGLKVNPNMERWCHTIDIDFALGLYGKLFEEGKNLYEVCGIYRHHLEIFNSPKKKELDDDLNNAVNAIIGSIRYEIVNQSLKITPKRKLVSRYFNPICDEEGNIITYAACNGWIFGGNPTEDFAGPNSKAYLRRELIIWEDSIKLRYGKGPEDSPWLWEHMKNYTEQSARLFHGLRLDNCHSTPLHVARYLIDAARKIRPELYVVAELFTGSTDLDRLYISKLGINSLIREAMQVPNATEMSRLCFLYGGGPVGSVVRYYPPQYYDKDNSTITYQRDLPILSLAEPPALFFDCTHDNEVPAEKRHPRDSLSNAALVAMVACPIGSTRGYDQIIPHRLDVVKENRLYPLGVHEGEPTGMTAARKVFNELHRRLEEEGYSEQHTHQDGDVIVIQRHNPINHKAVYATCRTSFSREDFNDRHIYVKVPGKITNYLGYFSLEVKNHSQSYSNKYIQGMESQLKIVYSEEELQNIFTTSVCSGGVDQYVEIRFKNFTPGSVLLFEVELPETATTTINELYKIDEDYSLDDCLHRIDATEFGYLFYSCENEELAITNGKGGCYDIPNYGKLPYAGIAGIVGVLNIIRKNNDMGHPLFDNLRSGNWLMDYILERLQISRKYRSLYKWLTNYFNLVKTLPRHYIPKYFDKVMLKYYKTGINYVCTNLMGPFISTNIDNFVEQLALTSFQFVGADTGSVLINPQLADFGKTLKVSMAAGLPHFSSGFMRVWGRDTFISLRGLLLVTDRWQEARDLLIGFGSSLRHGLIPNLLDSGNNPRYNARDATWWFLQSLQDYCTMSPEGTKILQEMVPSLFPWDTYYNNGARTDHKKLMSTIVQDIMQCHAKGIDFRERNAGPKIDDKMRDEGFNIKIRFDPKTGFIFGGNQHNCGTWMDKMGESHRAGNYGVPATPRDGADIEIIGLLKSTTRWLSQLYKDKIFPHKGVAVNINPLYPDETCLVTYWEWDISIQENFEKYFYIPLDPNEDHKYMINKQIVNKRGIYKDIVGCTTEWADYQLRPNQCVTMVVAPELFDRQHAYQALETIEKVLVGPLGMKTLDPSDWNYRPNYDNSSDTDDYKTSHGFNYHQGPEWLWCYGYFLRAKIKFGFPSENTKLVKIRNAIQQLTQHHRQHITEDKWQGLPELTNENGKFCYFSCPTQAWSSATILDALYDLHFIK